MKTNNFKMSFLTELDNHPVRVTRYTFGFTQVDIDLTDMSYFGSPEHFELRYYNNGKLKMMISTYSVPEYLRNLVSNLYYGFLNYCYVGYKSPAFQVIGVLRSLDNYYKRKGLNYAHD